jgi:mannosyltransferase
VPLQRVARQGDRRLWLDVLAPLVAMSALVIVVLPTLGSRSLWLDEAFTVGNSRTPLLEIGRLNGGSMLGYYASLKPLVGSLEGEFWLRLPSLVALVVATIPFHRIARRLFAEGPAALATLFFALNPITVAYAREARAYAFVILVVCISWWALLRVLDADRPSGASKAMWVGATAITGYMHLLSLLVLPAQMLVVAHRRGPMRAAREWILPISAIAILVLPLVWFATNPAADAANWIPSLSADQAIALARTLLGWDAATATGIGVSILVIIGAHRLARAVGERPGDDATVIAAWLVVPLVLLATLSLVQPHFIFRYTIPVTPAIALLVGSAAEHLRNSGGSRLAMGIAVVIAVVVPGWDYQTTNEDWRALTALLVEHTQENDGVLVMHGRLRTPVDVYLDWSDESLRATPLLPIDPWGSPLRIYASPDELDVTAVTGDVWVIHRFSGPASSALATAELERAGFEQMHLWVDHNLRVGLSQHRRTTS